MTRLGKAGTATLVVFAALGLLAGILGRIMDFGLRRDEMMYAPPARLMDGFSLYSDLFYNHLPYSAWIFRGAHLLLADAPLLFTTRLTVFLAWVLMAVALLWLVHRITRSVAMAGFAAIAILANDLLLSTPGMAGTNNFLPLPFAFIGLALVALALIGDRPRAPGLVIAGICLSIAVGIKISAVMYVPAAALAGLVFPRTLSFGQRLRQVVLPLAVGGLIGAIPLIAYLVADPELFVAHVVEFHTGPHIAYWEANRASEPDLALGLSDKIRLAFQFWFTGSNLLIAAVILALAAAPSLDRETGAGPVPGLPGAIAIVTVTLALTAAMSFVPTPSFEQYYVQPLACLPLLAALLYRRLGDIGRLQAAPILLAASLLMLLIAAPRLAPSVTAYLKPGATVVAQVAEGGTRLRAALEARGLADGKVLTLSPIYPVEGGLAVYTAFATGQFGYRIVPYTGEQLLSHYNIVGRDQLDGYLAEDPPAAILVGFEPELEAPFIAYAENSGYERVADIGIIDRYGSAILYVRPQ